MSTKSQAPNGQFPSFFDTDGNEYSVALVTKGNSWTRDDLFGYEGKGYIVCEFGGLPFAHAIFRFSLGAALNDLETFSKMFNWKEAAI